MLVNRKAHKPPPKPDWVECATYDKGTELTFKDHDGINRRARYLRSVYSIKHDTFWLDVMELNAGDNMGVRSISADQVRKVWRKKKKNITRKERLKERGLNE